MGSTSVSTRHHRIDAQLASWRSTRRGRLMLLAASIGLLAAVYYAAAKIGLRLAYLHGAVTALWPPVGVGIAALVLYGPRLWPGIVIGDLLVATSRRRWARCSARPSATRSRWSSPPCSCAA